MCMKKPEILSPIQDFTSLTAAIDAGADAVFFGVIGFNMRVTAKNFTVLDIPLITEKAHAAGVKVYLALNTIVYQEELEEVRGVLEASLKAGVDAVICWDLSVVQIAKSIGLPIHLSTQASVANAEAALFYKELGISRIVLARECDLEQIKKIKEKADIEIEVFIHGAMCVSISGRCFMSQFTTCHSANRGECRQPCRRNYMIRDVEGQYEFEVGPNYVLSPKDICTLPFIEELVFAGIDCFKIEGRNKSAEYVAQVTSVYREVVDFVWDNKDRTETAKYKKELAELKEKHMKNLERVFTRGFSSGFFMGKPLNEWTNKYGNAGTERKVFIGKIVNVYKKIGVAEVHIQSNEQLKVGDEIYVQGEKTGIVRVSITSMEIEHKKVTSASQGELVAIQVEGEVRKTDEVYRIDPIECANPKNLQ
ncbi:TPA: protease [Patescibacteria group bacterium]|nr:MAG: Peptidase U32 [Parcubacteria group bacterium GW2011_GWD2_42_14]HCC05408.1 protease [Patescibacteria group bacterium]